MTNLLVIKENMHWYIGESEYKRIHEYGNMHFGMRRMAVGFKVKYYWYQVGNGDFLHSFFYNKLSLTIAFLIKWTL